MYAELKRHGPFKDEEENPRLWMKQIAKALEICHQNQIIHRDVKIDNFLLTSPEVVKLGDFGFSVLLPEKGANGANGANSTAGVDPFKEGPCGTADYLSPEMINWDSYDTRTDVWSFGVAIYELLYGVTPFESSTLQKTQKNIRAGKFTLTKDISEDAQNLLHRLLVVDPKKRATWEEILNHAWW